ncbi:MAG: hypothetical protein KF713_07065 [Turneriella sp.]|nr:hypothetical protein [Turneriella sp.]
MRSSKKDLQNSKKKTPAKKKTQEQMIFGRKKSKAAEPKPILDSATSDELFIVDQVRKVQVERLRQTYDDFFQNPEFTKISKYFFEQIYGAGDKASRDAAFNKIYEKLSAAVNPKRIQRVTQLKQLNELTDELDLAVAREFMKMKKKSAMTLKDFETCYKALNNKPERELQLQLLMETTRFFHKLAHVPLLGFVIKPTQLAAKMLGVEYIMEFFMEGYRSFKSVKDAEPFMVAIEERERAYLNKLLP